MEPSGHDKTVSARPGAEVSRGPAHTRVGGAIASRYRILDLLGAGGMGTVFRARDEVLGEPVAVKVMNRDLAQDAPSLERFRREVRLARRVSHRNVARVFDIGDHDGEPFLVMELIDGESLATELKRGPMAIARIVDVATAVCAGLGAAHEAGVIHRDLKPENVLVGRDGRIVIGDFGVARPVASSATTEWGVVLGTPWYMAPEQLEGAADLDHRADLWALGVMLYEMIAGVRPYPGDTMGAIALAQTRGPQFELRAVRADAPPALIAATLRCLDRARERRFANAADVARAITQVGAATTRPTTGAGTAAVVTLAVLPLRAEPGDAALADGLLDDLIDTLSMTPGLRVRSRGAVVALGQLAPEEAGARLDVAMVVEGSLRRRGDQVRIAARLIHVGDGFQVHATRVDCAAHEVLATGDRLAREIAGALSMRVDRQVARPTDPRAVELYLRARIELRRWWRAPVAEAVALLEQARALAPDAPAVLATRAFAHVRLWLMAEGARSGELAYQAALDAIAVAPRHGEARLALGMARVNRGEVLEGVADIAWAVSHAPLLSDAHEQAGRLLVEIGAEELGLARLRDATRLDPDKAPLLDCEIARVHALFGRWELVARLIAPALADDDPAMRAVAQVLAARLALWRGERPDRAAWTIGFATDNALVRIFAAALLDRVLAEDDWQWMMTFVGEPTAALRSRLFAGQVAVELAAACGMPDRAMAALGATVDTGLFDQAWLEGCPLIAPLVGDPRLAELRRRVAERAAQVLAAYHAADVA
ncbi:MAG: protein kinase [Deltaproteobacteria bacterium]|nr:protein kinase [Deltaproteobacteria bacterium]